MKDYLRLTQRHGYNEQRDEGNHVKLNIQIQEKYIFLTRRLSSNLHKGKQKKTNENSKQQQPPLTFHFGEYQRI